MEKKRFCDFAMVEPMQFEFTYYQLGKRYTETFNSTDLIGENPPEWQYSVIDVIGDILSLKINETRWCCAIRHDKHSKGVICRIK